MATVCKIYLDLGYNQHLEISLPPMQQFNLVPRVLSPLPATPFTFAAKKPLTYIEKTLVGAGHVINHLLDVGRVANAANFSYTNICINYYKVT